ncbi:unnamed protein product, partial [Coccothraustes coccothraustes]
CTKGEEIPSSHLPTPCSGQASAPNQAREAGLEGKGPDATAWADAEQGFSTASPVPEPGREAGDTGTGPALSATSQKPLHVPLPSCTGTGQGGWAAFPPSVSTQNKLPWLCLQWSFLLVWLQ